MVRRFSGAMRPPRTFLRNNSSGSPDFFARNGEILLQMQISFSPGRSNPIRTFSFREIQEATGNFDHGHLLASSLRGYYWGNLDDRKVVVKHGGGASHNDDTDHLEKAHITEIVILTAIRHRNVVKLLGCCLETRVPLLVYEFLPGLSLRHNMELWVDKRIEIPPWSTRLQIALDVADALNYLHSCTSRPIVHKNVKAANIILGEDYTAKLVGFSYSVPIPPGKAHVKDDTVCGTFGYVDPEYAFTGTLTEKVDVYAFGRLLLELLVGASLCEYLNREGNDSLLEVLVRKEDMWDAPANHDRVDVITVLEGGRRSEAYQALKECCLAKLVADASALGDGEGKPEQLRAIAELALLCARPRTRERPAMKEVVEELRRTMCMVQP